jgi:hypothetical protein
MDSGGEEEASGDSDGVLAFERDSKCSSNGRAGENLDVSMKTSMFFG